MNCNISRLAGFTKCLTKISAATTLRAGNAASLRFIYQHQDGFHSRGMTSGSNIIGPGNPTQGANMDVGVDVDVDANIDQELDIMKRRLIWQARKRGILESDLVLSSFISDNINSMDRTQVAEFEQLISEHNDWDLYYWLSGTRQPPEAVQQLQTFRMLVDHVVANSKPTSNAKSLLQGKFKRMPDLEDIKK